MESISKIPSKDARKINFNFEMMFISYNDRDNIKKIKEIEGGRILLLSDHFFMILNLKTKKQICFIIRNFGREYYRYSDIQFDDFIELKNRDLIIWSKAVILHYKKSGDNYEIKQIINEFEQQYDQTKIGPIRYVPIYNLYKIIELDNNVLLSCNSLGINIYRFINNEYKSETFIPMFLDVENVIKIDGDNFLVVHHLLHSSSNGFQQDIYHEFALSLINLNPNGIKKKYFIIKLAEMICQT